MKNELHRAVAILQLMANDTELSKFVTSEDLLLMKRRALAEGIEFLTVTLPTLGKALDTAFESGIFVCPDGWRPAKETAYPKFLHKAWECLFDVKGQARWVVPDALQHGLLSIIWKEMGDAVACIRQISYAYYKYERPWSDSQATATFNAFKDAEGEVDANHRRLLAGGLSEKIGSVTVGSLLDRAEALIGRLLAGTNPLEITPRYGTGATADKATVEERWVEPRFIPRLDEVYPYCEWFVSGINGLDEVLTSNRLTVPTCEEPGARVCLVPKDSRGPRLISAEPREFMYIQQGLMTLLYDTIERYPYVRSQVSCTDQTRNQRLAMIGSQTGGLATLDLKEASDRVPWWLVVKLFPNDWVTALESCRSEYTVLPSGEEVPLRKFAPMGSACCFPVEALVFWALCHASQPSYSGHVVRRLLRTSDDTRDICSTPNYIWSDRTVCVFGDDIIVPTETVGPVVQLLESVGLKVNLHKSFYNGPFRESCGKDYFAGVLVTPVRVKHMLAGDDLEIVFRTKDVLQNIVDVYGESEPSLLFKARELFKRFFGLELPVFPLKETQASSSLCLYDKHWGQRLDGETLKFRKGYGWFVVDVRMRLRNPGKDKPCYNRLQAHLLTEVPVKETHDLAWWSVLRSFLISGGRGGTDEYALRGRVNHKTKWVQV